MPVVAWTSIADLVDDVAMPAPETRPTGSSSKVPQLRWRWVLTVAVGATVITGVVMWALIAHVGNAPNATETDLAERRITELYTKAVEQLGSDKAPVRLGGLYSLERLANSNAGHRQTIVNVICAYLRMPYHPPRWSRRGPVEIEPKNAPSEDEHARREELQVRLTAQRILADHLNESATNEASWGALDIDLREAVLVDFKLENCDVGRADFAHARFVGAVHIHDTKFCGEAWFFETAFDALANFSRTTFTDRAIFTATEFHDDFSALSVVFLGGAYFWNVKFCRLAAFEGATFHKDVEFAGAHINASDKDIRGAMARGGWPAIGINFGGALVMPRSSAKYHRSWPTGWQTGPESVLGSQLIHTPPEPPGAQGSSPTKGGN